MNRAELKFAAKKHIQGNIWMYLLCSFIFAAITGVCALIPGIGWIGSIILVPTLTLGMTLITLGMTHGIKPDVATLFDGFKNFGPAIILYLLTGIFTFLWSLLLFVPGIIKAISYSMGYYIMAEHPEMTGTEALNESKRIMQGHKWDFFVLQLSFILWGMLVSITFGIAGIYVFPYMTTTNANFYNSIKDGSNPINGEATFTQSTTSNTTDYSSASSETTFTDSSETNNASDDGTYNN